MESFRSVDTTRLWIAASIPVSGKIENGGYYSRAAVAAMDPNERHHFSCGVFLPGKTTHLEQYATEFPFVLLDDVGKLPANFRPGIDKSVHGNLIDSDEFLFMPTSWVMETSAYNHQYGYQIKPAMTPFQAKLVNKALKLDPRFAASAADISTIQYARLPSGRNSKANKGNFPTRLVSRDPDVTYTFDEFVKGLNLDIDAALWALTPKKAVASAETCSVETMKAILDALPNTFSRPDWTGICHAIQNTLGEDGREVWVDWSETYKKPGDPTHVAKPGEAERVWETLPAGHQNDLGSLRKILIDLHGEDSDVVRAIKGRISNEQSGGFTAIDPTTIPASPSVSPDARKEDAAKKRLDDLLKEARKLAPIPDQHRGEEDRNWLGKDGALVDALDRLGMTPSAAPTVIQPHVKGVVTMIAGPPSKSKSTLALNQALAIAYADQSLIRWGQDRLQFPGDVVYVSNEDPLNTVDRRMKAFAKVHGLAGRPRQHGFFPVTSKLLSRSAKGEVTIECLRIVEAMVARLKAGGRIAFMVVDTMPSSILGFEENSSQEMAEVLALLHRIARAFWCSVVFVHHGTKAGWDNGDARTLAAAARGTGGLTGSVRGLVVMSDPTEEDRSRYKLPLTGHRFVVEFLLKNSDGRQGEVVGIYEIISVDIDVLDAETGLPVTDSAPVLVPWKSAHSFTVVSTPADEQVWLDRLEKATSPMRRYKAKAQKRHVKDDSVHHVLDVTVEAAYDIIEILKGKGLVRVDENTNDHTEWVVVERIF